MSPIFTPIISENSTPTGTPELTNTSTPIFTPKPTDTEIPDSTTELSPTFTPIFTPNPTSSPTITPRQTDIILGNTKIGETCESNNDCLSNFCSENICSFSTENVIELLVVKILICDYVIMKIFNPCCRVNFYNLNEYSLDGCLPCESGYKNNRSDHHLSITFVT